MSVLDQIAKNKQNADTESGPSFEYNAPEPEPERKLAYPKQDEENKLKATTPYENSGVRDGMNYEVLDIYGAPVNTFDLAKRMTGAIPKDIFENTSRDGGTKLNMEIDRAIASHKWGIESMTLSDKVDQKVTITDDVTSLTYIIRTWK